MTKNATNKELYARLAEKTAELEKMRKEIENFCDLNGLVWGYYPSYGMGGTYYPDADNYISEYSDTTYPVSDDEKGRWLASSHNC